jgi:site-specific recombinase XerD
MKNEKEFIAYLQSKDLSQLSQKHYVYNVTRFLFWYKKDPLNCTEKDIVKYLDYLQNVRNMQNITRRNHLIAIDHYFNFLELKHITSFIKIRGTKKKRLHYVFSGEELTQLYDDYYHVFIQNFQPERKLNEKQKQNILLSRQRNYVMLGFFVYQGLISTELDLLHISDIDFLKATIKIRTKNRGNDRVLPLNASQTGALMNYIQNIRPHFLTEKETTDKLFLPLSQQNFSGEKNNLSITVALSYLSKQLKSLHPKFLKLSQLRTSVITLWLKTEGLRKAQYWAGHKSIVSTEEYQPNNFEELADDLTKFNPF